MADHPVGDMEDAEAVHHRGGGLEWVGDGASGFCGDDDGFERGQRRAGQQVLGDVADVVGLAGGGDGAGRGGFEPGDSFDQGGLTGGVGAEEAGDGAGGAQAKGHVMEDRGASVGNVEVCGDDHG